MKAAAATTNGGSGGGGVGVGVVGGMVGAAKSSRFDCNVVFCRDCQKPDGPICTGIGFLDHMIDQFNSHAQIGVTMTIRDFAAYDSDDHAANANADANAGTGAGDDVADGSNHNESPNSDCCHDDRNRYAACGDQGKLLSLVGSKLGRELKQCLEESPTAGTYSRFGCPLDEALVVCILRRKNSNTAAAAAASSASAGLSVYDLAPYGKYPPSTGRTRLGKLKTAHLRNFWEALADHAGLDISLHKVRGNNGHHIVEASFKAFCRALRNLLDGITTDNDNEDNEDVNAAGTTTKQLLECRYGVDSDNFRASTDLGRCGTIHRQTKETSIDVDLKLDGGGCGGSSAVSVNTGIAVLDGFLKTMFECAGMTLTCHCSGDLWIDEHHTAEDVAIAVGQALDTALGSKAGLNRMWCATAEVAAAAAAGNGNGNITTKVEATVDLSNRPCLVHDLKLSSSSAVVGQEEEGHHHLEMAGDLSLEMVEHVLESFVTNARMTVHLVQHASDGSGKNVQDVITATAMALGRALRYCAAVDTRRAGATASSKGTLSV